MNINKITTKKLDSKIRYVRITPERAEELLQYNYPGQRKLRPGVVFKYATDMMSGRFHSKMLGQPLMAEWDLKTGEFIWLLDGMHRMNGIIESGLTQEFLLVWETHENFEYIDNGAKRETKDYINRPNAGVFSSAVDKVIRLRKINKGSAINTIASRSTSTRNEILDFERFNPAISDRLDDIIKGANKIKNQIQKGGSAAAFAGIGWMLFELGLDDHWEQFCDDCGKTDPDSAAIRAFTKWRLEEIAKNSGIPQRDKYSLTGILWMYDNFKGWRKDRKYQPKFGEAVGEKYDALWLEKNGGTK